MAPHFIPICEGLPSRSGGPGVGISIGTGVGVASVGVGRRADVAGTADTGPVVAGLDSNDIRVGGLTGVILESNVAMGSRGRFGTINNAEIKNPKILTSWYWPRGRQSRSVCYLAGSGRSKSKQSMTSTL